MTTRYLPYTRSCFVCGADNSSGLKLRFRVNGDAVEADWTPREEHIGFRGIIHGGILATVLDEVMVWAASVSTKRFHFCAELTVRYSKSVRQGERLRLVGRVARDRGRVVETEGELRDAEGQTCAKATAKYMPVPDEQVAHLLEDFVPDAATIPIEEILGSKP